MFEKVKRKYLDFEFNLLNCLKTLEVCLRNIWVLYYSFFLYIFLLSLGIVSDIPSTLTSFLAHTNTEASRNDI